PCASADDTTASSRCPSIVSSYSLFLYASHYPVYLHSFPTRRSSDQRREQLAPVHAEGGQRARDPLARRQLLKPAPVHRQQLQRLDRKSTRLNSSHVKISYAVFCLKKKNCIHNPID